MGKDVLKNWFLISYHTPSTHLVGGSRISKLHQFLNTKNIVSTLITRDLADVNKGGQVIQEPTFVRHLQKLLSALFVPDASIFWALKVYRYLSQRKSGVIVTTMPLYGLSIIGLLNATRQNKHFWIADFRDSWLLNPLYKPFLFFIKKPLLKWFEKSVFEKADLILFNTPKDLQDHLIKFPVLKNKAISIPNGFDKIIKPNHARYSNEKQLTLVYAGNHYPDDQAVKNIIHYLEQINKNGNKVVCHVYGKQHEKWKSCPYIKYKGLKSQKEIATILSHYNVGIIYLQPECKNGGRIPQKFYDYIGSGVKPIIINASYELKKHIGLVGGEEVNLKNEPEQLLGQLRTMFEADNTINDELLQTYTRQVQFEKLSTHVSSFLLQ